VTTPTRTNKRRVGFEEESLSRDDSCLSESFDLSFSRGPHSSELTPGFDSCRITTQDAVDGLLLFGSPDSSKEPLSLMIYTLVTDCHVALVVVFRTAETPLKDSQFNISSPFSPENTRDWLSFSPQFEESPNFPFGPASASLFVSHTPHRDFTPNGGPPGGGMTPGTGASEGIAQLLAPMSSTKKTRLKRNLEPDSIFEDDANTSSHTNTSATLYPPPPASGHRVVHSSDGDDQPDDLSLHRYSKIRRMNRGNGPDDHFDRLTVDMSPHGDGDLEPNELMACLETPMKQKQSWMKKSSTSPVITTQRKKRQQCDLIISSPNEGNERMTTRQRSRGQSTLTTMMNMSTTPLIESSPLIESTGHTSPIEHQSPPGSAGYLSPLPEKSSKRRHALPSHPASCSPYKTRSQSRYETTVIPPVMLGEDRRDMRFVYSIISSVSVTSTDHIIFLCSSSTDYEDMSLVNSINESHVKEQQPQQQHPSPISHPPTPSEDDQYEILQSLFSPPPQKNHSYYPRSGSHGIHYHLPATGTGGTGHNSIFSSPLPEEPQKVSFLSSYLPSSLH
jgi:hypothetical protein